ncbi:TRAP-like protein, putative [Plasmodium ovale]|uniref:TRAP-like protein, putative n=1 Tax=Plasmodium ovale TaxID=36330 RepID=A0A1D3TLN9_PLAOA|nr:TRAP-like protein, putative [Plasmodium ovale]
MIKRQNDKIAKWKNAKMAKGVGNIHAVKIRSLRELDTSDGFFRDYCKGMTVHYLISAEEVNGADFLENLLFALMGTMRYMMQNKNHLFSVSIYDEKIVYQNVQVIDKIKTFAYVKDLRQAFANYVSFNPKNTNLHASLREYYENTILTNPLLKNKKNVIIICKNYTEIDSSKYTDELINYIRDIRSNDLGIFFFTENRYFAKNTVARISESLYRNDVGYPLVDFIMHLYDGRGVAGLKKFCYHLKYGSTCARYGDWSEWSGSCEFRTRQREIPLKISMSPSEKPERYYEPTCRNVFNYNLSVREELRVECQSNIYECRGICDKGYKFKPYTSYYEIIENYVECNDLPKCTDEQKQNGDDVIYKDLLAKLLNEARASLNNDQAKRRKIEEDKAGEIEEQSNARRVVAVKKQLDDKMRAMLEKQRDLLRMHEQERKRKEQVDVRTEEQTEEQQIREERDGNGESAGPNGEGAIPVGTKEQGVGDHDGQVKVAKVSDNNGKDIYTTEEEKKHRMMKNGGNAKQEVDVLQGNDNKREEESLTPPDTNKMDEKIREDIIDTSNHVGTGENEIKNVSEENNLNVPKVKQTSNSEEVPTEENSDKSFFNQKNGENRERVSDHVTSIIVDDSKNRVHDMDVLHEDDTDDQNKLSNGRKAHKAETGKSSVHRVQLNEEIYLPKKDGKSSADSEVETKKYLSSEGKEIDGIGSEQTNKLKKYSRNDLNEQDEEGKTNVLGSPHKYIRKNMEDVNGENGKRTYTGETMGAEQVEGEERAEKGGEEEGEKEGEKEEEKEGEKEGEKSDAENKEGNVQGGKRAKEQQVANEIMVKNKIPYRRINKHRFQGKTVDGSYVLDASTSEDLVPEEDETSESEEITELSKKDVTDIGKNTGKDNTSEIRHINIQSHVAHGDYNENLEQDKHIMPSKSLGESTQYEHQTALDSIRGGLTEGRDKTEGGDITEGGETKGHDLKGEKRNMDISHGKRKHEKTIPDEVKSENGKMEKSRSHNQSESHIVQNKYQTYGHNAKEENPTLRKTSDDSTFQDESNAKRNLQVQTLEDIVRGQPIEQHKISGEPTSEEIIKKDGTHILQIPAKHIRTSHVTNKSIRKHGELNDYIKETEKEDETIKEDIIPSDNISQMENLEEETEEFNIINKNFGENITPDTSTSHKEMHDKERAKHEIPDDIISQNVLSYNVRNSDEELEAENGDHQTSGENAIGEVISHEIKSINESSNGMTKESQPTGEAREEEVIPSNVKMENPVEEETLEDYKMVNANSGRERTQDDITKNNKLQNEIRRKHNMNDEDYASEVMTDNATQQINEEDDVMKKHELKGENKEDDTNSSDYIETEIPHETSNKHRLSDEHIQEQIIPGELISNPHKATDIMNVDTSQEKYHKKGEISKGKKSQNSEVGYVDNSKDGNANIISEHCADDGKMCQGVHDRTAHMHVNEDIVAGGGKVAGDVYVDEGKDAGEDVDKSKSTDVDEDSRVSTDVSESEDEYIIGYKGETGGDGYGKNIAEGKHASVYSDEESYKDLGVGEEKIKHIDVGNSVDGEIMGEHVVADEHNLEGKRRVVSDQNPLNEYRAAGEDTVGDENTLIGEQKAPEEHWAGGEHKLVGEHMTLGKSKDTGEHKTSEEVYSVDKHEATGEHKPVDEDTVVSENMGVDEYKTGDEHNPVGEDMDRGMHKPVGENVTANEHKLIAEDVTAGEHNPVDEDMAGGEHKPVGEHKVVDEHNPIGENKPVDEDVTVGEHKSVDEDVTVGEHKSIGEHGTVGEQMVVDEHNPVGEHRATGEHKDVYEHELIVEDVTAGEHNPVDEDVTVGEHKPVDENVTVGEHGAIGEHKVVDEHNPVGEHKVVDEHNPVGEHKDVYEHKLVAEDVAAGEHKPVDEDVTVGEHKSVGEQTVVDEHNPVGEHKDVYEHKLVAEDVTAGEHKAVDEDVTVGEHKSVGEQTVVDEHNPVGEHGAIGEHKVVDEHNPVGEHKPVDEDVTAREHKPIDENVTVGEHGAVGKHGVIGEHKVVDEHNPVGEHGATGEHKDVYDHKLVAEDVTAGEHKAVDEDVTVGEHKSVGEQTVVDEHNPVGEHKVVDEHNPVGEHNPVDEDVTAREHKPIDENVTVGEHGAVDEDVTAREHKPIDENATVGEHGAVGEHKVVDEHNPVGEHKVVDEHNPVGEHNPVDEDVTAREHKPIDENVTANEHKLIAEDVTADRHKPVGEDVTAREHKPIDENVTVGEHGAVDEDVTAREHKPIDENASVGEHKYVGEHKVVDEHKPIGEDVTADEYKLIAEDVTAHRHKPVGEHKHTDENLTVGEHNHVDEDMAGGEHKSVGEHKVADEHNPVGEYETVGEYKTVDEHKPVGEDVTVGEHKYVGEHGATGEHKDVYEHKLIAEDVTAGEHKPVGENVTRGENKPTGEDVFGGDHALKDEKKDPGEHRTGGVINSVDGDNPADEHKAVGSAEVVGEYKDAELGNVTNEGIVADWGNIVNEGDFSDEKPDNNTGADGISYENNINRVLKKDKADLTDDEFVKGRYSAANKTESINENVGEKVNENAGENVNHVVSAEGREQQSDVTNRRYDVINDNPNVDVTGEVEGTSAMGGEIGGNKANVMDRKIKSQTGNNEEHIESNYYSANVKGEQNNDGNIPHEDYKEVHILDENGDNSRSVEKDFLRVLDYKVDGKGNVGISSHDRSKEKLEKKDSDVSKEGVSKEEASKEGVPKEEASKEGVSKEGVSKEEVSKEGVSKEEVSKEKGEENKSRVTKKKTDPSSPTINEREQNGNVPSRTIDNLDPTFTKDNITVSSEESNRKELENGNNNEKNINDIIEKVVNDFNNPNADIQNKDDINKKLDVLDDFVENSKKAQGGHGDYPYKYYSDTKSVQKIYYKKSSDGDLENKKYIIVGQNNFIIDSDDSKNPFPQNMSNTVHKMLEEQIQKDIDNTIKEDEKEKEKSKSYHSKTFKYAGLTIFAGAFVVLASMYIFKKINNYRLSEKNDSNDTQYQFTSKAVINEDTEKDITCGEIGYGGEEWS